jgi:rubrerythrin
MSEFFALASAMEADAVARYTETARQLRQQDSGELADVFDRLAETERGHVRQVEEWAKSREASVPHEPPWAIPDTFDSPPEDYARSKLMTPYLALASAVRHEQRSFAFWTYVAAHADKADVKEAAERMALEELEHVSLLRRERRKAFHAQRQRSSSSDRLITLGSLAAMERRLADLIERHPECATGGRNVGLSLAGSSREAAGRLEALGAARDLRISVPALPADRSDDIASIAEYLAEAYLRAAEASREASILGLAQDLAKFAIYRLAMLGAENTPDAPQEEERLT